MDAFVLYVVLHQIERARAARAHASGAAASRIGGGGAAAAPAARANELTGHANFQICRSIPKFPEFYKGRRGFHMVMHHLPPTGQRPASFPFDPEIWSCGYACIGHAYAKDIRGPWHYSPVPAASNVVQFAGGGTAVMRRRERPQVLTDGKGDVLVLYTGVEDPSRPDGRPDLSYTLAAGTTALMEDQTSHTR